MRDRRRQKLRAGPAALKRSRVVADSVRRTRKTIRRSCPEIAQLLRPGSLDSAGPGRPEPDNCLRSSRGGGDRRSQCGQLFDAQRRWPTPSFRPLRREGAPPEAPRPSESLAGRLQETVPLAGLARPASWCEVSEHGQRGPAFTAKSEIIAAGGSSPPDIPSVTRRSPAFEFLLSPSVASANMATIMSIRGNAQSSPAPSPSTRSICVATSSTTGLFMMKSPRRVREPEQEAGPAPKVDVRDSDHCMCCCIGTVCDLEHH